MASLEPAVISLIPGVFVLVVLLKLRSELREPEAEQRINRSLGFAADDPEPQCSRKICSAYRPFDPDRRSSDEDDYQLQNVAIRRLMNCDLFIFDLVNTADGETRVIERQAVAVVAPDLKMPTFVIFRREDVEGPAVCPGHQGPGSPISRFGDLVEFDGPTAFAARYTVGSPDPDGTRQFLDESRQHQLAKAQLPTIHAGDDVLVLSHTDLPTGSDTEQTLPQRVELATRLYSMFGGKS